MWLSNSFSLKRTYHSLQLIGLGLVCALFVVVANSFAKTVATHAYSLTPLTTKTVAVQSKTPTTPTPTPTVAAVSAPVTAPDCTPDTLYTTPGAIAPVQPGLQQVIDNPSTYTVYGNTTAQINAQIAKCTPVLSAGTGGAAGRYAASTANTVSWQTSYNDTGNDICSVATVDVTLHINQVFPEWQPTVGSPASLASTWQTYSTKLHAYEQGHVELDEQAAQSVLTDLQNLPATSCDTIDQLVNNTANSDLASYLTANANYDTSNDFGLSENVVL